MATAAAAKAPVEEAAAPAKKSGKKGLIITILVAFIMASAGAGGAYWFATKDSKAAAAKGKGKDTEKAAEEEHTGPPVYVNIDQFVVNLEGDGEGVNHYLQTSIVFSVKDSAAGDTLKQYMPLIRNKILLLLSSQHADELGKSDAKVKLAEQILKLTRDSLPKTKDESESKGIRDVLFSAFIIQ